MEKLKRYIHSTYFATTLNEKRQQPIEKVATVNDTNSNLVAHLQSVSLVKTAIANFRPREESRASSSSANDDNNNSSDDPTSSFSALQDYCENTRAFHTQSAMYNAPCVLCYVNIKQLMDIHITVKHHFSDLNEIKQWVVAWEKLLQTHERSHHALFNGPHAIKDSR
jgi:uncharacterized protein YdiU (UPF0061 family)